MRKILTLVALAALAFTSCMKEDENYKRLKRVELGVNIYNGTMTMQRIAMQPADVAVRLAIVMAEAHKQDPTNADPDLTKIMVNDGKVNLFNNLIGDDVLITKTDNGYKLVFDVKTPIKDFYQCGGTVEVQTNGKQLVEATSETPWEVILGSDFEVQIYNPYGAQHVLATASSIELYYDQIGTYLINVDGFMANTKDSGIKSDWKSNLMLTPPSGGASLAYSDIKGKRFSLDGTASGPSCVTFNSKSNTRLSYRVTDAKPINYLDTASGTVECALIGTNDYDPAYEKDKEVTVVFSWPNENKPPVAMLTWNMITENVTGYVR